MHAQPRRKPLRMDAQDGPWSISVAENPSDTKSYSIYIQSKLHLTTQLLFLIILHSPDTFVDID